MNFLLQASTTTPATTAITGGGWAFMLLSIGFVVVLTAWCFYKVLTVPHPEDEAIPPAGLGA
jgi:hypothetical protein